MKYGVYATIVGVGKVQHVIKADSPGEAFEKFQRAWPDREVILRKVVRQIEKASQ